MSQFITFTDSAIHHIKKELTKKENSIGFRLSIKKTGCSGYAYLPEIIESIHPDDYHFMAQDNIAVYIDSSAADLLKDITIDYASDENNLLKQKKLIFTNPQEKNRCGCGESFTL